MKRMLTLQREHQLVKYAIFLLSKDNFSVFPIQTESCVFPIIFINKKLKSIGDKGCYAYEN